MPPLLQFVLRRFLVMPASLFVITLVLFGGVMLTPPEARAALYAPVRINPNLSSEQENQIRGQIVSRYHLSDPFLVQYYYWVRSLFDGTWGYSPSMGEEVLPALLRRTPVTLELAFYSLLVIIPLGLVSGLISGWKRGGHFDRFFRSAAFLSTSVPTFILALVLLSIFYVNLNWFSPERISLNFSQELVRGSFIQHTGFITFDSILNGRWDILVDSVKHLAMPVFTLALYHWATLGRVVRIAVLNERSREYIISARARGVSERSVVWKHLFRNVLPPSLTSMALSAAALVTGVFVAEIIFNFNGVSAIIVSAVAGDPDGYPDATAALGFAVYSVIMVLSLMFLLDVFQAVFDPRVRERVLG